MALDETLLGQEVMELESTAHWRSEKAALYPEDGRNAAAQVHLLKLAAQLRDIAGSPKAIIFETFQDFVFSDNEEENPVEVVSLWGEYRSRIGFNRFPSTAEEYLDELMELAREAT